jgi:hypothetical protein
LINTGLEYVSVQVIHYHRLKCTCYGAIQKVSEKGFTKLTQSTVFFLL